MVKAFAARRSARPFWTDYPLSTIDGDRGVPAFVDGNVPRYLDWMDLSFRRHSQLFLVLDFPAVIFELFNEPFDWWGTDPDHWNGWLNGTTQTRWIGDRRQQYYENWQTVGMQQLVNAKARVPLRRGLRLQRWGPDA